MRKLWALLIVASLASFTACASGGIPQARQLTPESMGGDTEGLAFTRLIIRVPAGTDIGGHHRGLLKIRHNTYTWGGNIAVASDQFRVIAAETMKQYGFNVLGGDDLLFGQDDSGKATYQIGGTIQDLRYNTYGALAGNKAEAWMKVEWQINNALQEKVVFADTTRGKAEIDDNDAGVAAVKNAFRAALTNLLANEDFVALVRAPGDSVLAGLASAETQSVPECVNPIATELPAQLDEAFRAAPMVRVGGGHGSGVVISPEGHLLTAAHVVSGVDHASAKFRSGLELEAEVLAVDPAQDIALLKLPGSGHACLPLETDPAMPVGTDVYAVGAPGMEELSFSVSRGVVSGHRTLDNYEFLQTDASINPGNSGGPLLDEGGRVIGVVSFKIAGTLYEGLAFGVPPRVLNERLGIVIQ